MPIQRTPDRLAAAEFVGAKAHQSVAQSLTNADYTVINLTVTDFDSGGVVDLVADRFTVPPGKGGKWLLVGSVGYTANATGVRDCDITKNGTSVAQTQLINAGSAWTVVPASVVVDAAPGDYFQLRSWHNAGAAINSGQGAFSTYLCATYLGPTVLPKLDGGLSLIGHVAYSPTTTMTYETTSTTLVDLDPTNLAVTFIAPPSGKVLVRLQARCAVLVTTDAATVHWGLREGTTDVMPSEGLRQKTGLNTQTLTLPVSGLVPGRQYTWKFAQRINNGSYTAQTQVGSGVISGIMEVWAVQ